jgi:PAT family beta-lactamase induction signal transducer AmpG
VKLPWTLKPLWSPLIEMYATRRLWILATQLCVLLGIAALAATTGASWLWIALACGWIALFSATHDIACDGFYMLALDGPTQAAWVGVRSTAFRVARIAAVSGVGVVAGHYEKAWDSVPKAWALALALGAVVYALGWLLELVLLPKPVADRAARGVERGPRFLTALASWFAQPKLIGVLLFVLLFRFGESMLTTMSGAFLLAPREKGGLGLDTETTSLLLGTVGVAAIVVGGILGGIVVARYGLFRVLVPMAIAMHLPNPLYIWLAEAQPSLYAVGAVIGLEQFAYGFGFAAYMVFLLHNSRRSAWPTTHYALSTGFMGLGHMIAGWISGDLVEAYGWSSFFVIVSLLALPGVGTIFLLPKTDETGR